MRRRFAIVVDGIVYSAPVVQAKIGGGHAQITMGKGPPAQQEHDAKELAAVVRAGALPVPLVFEKLERIPP